MHRDDFAMLSNNIVYFDNGATTLKPKCVRDAICKYYDEYTANAHRGDYKTSAIVDNLYESTREEIKNFINAKENSEIVFTSGTTNGMNMIVNGFFKNYLKKDDEVLITLSEHASNILPWFILQKEIGIKVKYIPLNENHEVTIDNFKKSITNKTKVVSLAYVTNVVGDERPIKEISKIAHDNNILVVVDAAQGIPHKKIDVQKDDIDFMINSADMPPYCLQKNIVESSIKLNVPCIFGGVGITEGSYGPLLTNKSCKIKYLKNINNILSKVNYFFPCKSSFGVTNSIISTYMSWDIIMYLLGEKKYVKSLNKEIFVNFKETKL